MKPSVISSSPLSFWLGIAVDVVTFVCALGAGLATSKLGAVEFTSVIFILTPLAFFVGLLLILTRDRSRPFPWLVTALWFAPLPVWFSTWQIVAVVRRLIL